MQGLLIGLSAIFATAIVGTLLCRVYASSKAKSNSLSKDA